MLLVFPYINMILQLSFLITFFKKNKRNKIIKNNIYMIDILFLSSHILSFVIKIYHPFVLEPCIQYES